MGKFLLWSILFLQKNSAEEVGSWPPLSLPGLIWSQCQIPLNHALQYDRKSRAVKLFLRKSDFFWEAFLTLLPVKISWGIFPNPSDWGIFPKINVSESI